MTVTVASYEVTGLVADTADAAGNRHTVELTPTAWTCTCADDPCDHRAAVEALFTRAAPAAVDASIDLPDPDLSPAPTDEPTEGDAPE